MNPKIYQGALAKAEPILAEISQKQHKPKESDNEASDHKERLPARGMESVIQEHLSKHIKGSKREVRLADVGMTQLWEGDRGFLDILAGTHGIELKVVRMPRLKASPSRALYDIGQLSSDFYRLSNSTILKSSELVVLVHGELIKPLDGKTELLREFHNRMYVDFRTAKEHQNGELNPHYKEGDDEYWRKRSLQIKCIKEMGFHKTFSRNDKARVVARKDDFALISITVRNGP